MGFKFEFDKGSVFRREVLWWIRSLNDLRWMWPGVSRSVEAHHQRVFDTEGMISERGGWIPLSRATAKARFFGWEIPSSATGAYASGSTQGAEGKILQWTGALRRSMSRRQSEYAIRKFQKRSMIFGTTHPGADTHQRGGQEPIGRGGKRKDVPPRPFMDPRGAMEGIGKSIHHQITKRFMHGRRN